MKKSYYFSIWACTIWGILVALNYSYFQGDKQNTDDTTVDFIQKLIIAILPAFITGLVTFLIGRKSRINNLSNNIDELKNLIGSQEGTTLTKYVSDTFYSIKEDIGRQDRGSLSKQHDNLQNMLKKEIELIEKRNDSDTNRLLKFDNEQQNIDNAINQFILFQKSWYKQVNTITELQAENSKLNAIIKEKERENDAIREELKNTYQLEIKVCNEKIESLTQQNKLLSSKLEANRINHQNKFTNTNVKDEIISKNNFRTKDDDEIEL